MFQIRDDLIDLTHGKGREQVGSDIREGKRSFLVAYTCEHASPADRAELISILDLPRDETTADHVDRAMQIFQAYNALDEAKRVCAELKASALGALKTLPAGLRNRLSEVTEYLVERAT